MGLLSILGIGKKEKPPPVYDPPFIVLPPQMERRSEENEGQWEKRRKEWMDKMEKERQRRSKYGGF